MKEHKGPPVQSLTAGSRMAAHQSAPDSPQRRRRQMPRKRRWLPSSNPLQAAVLKLRHSKLQARAGHHILES
ncbi:unnamed protein product [Lampetra planeri]